MTTQKPQFVMTITGSLMTPVLVIEMYSLSVKEKFWPNGHRSLCVVEQEDRPPQIFALDVLVSY